MTKIVIEINSCRECPFFKTSNEWSSDGFDKMQDWICTKLNPNKKIKTNVEWFEYSKINVPEWCPIKL